MKIQIISERRVGMLKPVFTSEGLRYIRSIYYAITKCKIGRKVVPNVTFAEITRYGEVEPYYGSHLRKRKQKTSTTLTIEINGKTKTYEVLKYNMKEKGDIRTVNLEVK